MRVLLQRVAEASVRVDEQVVGRINRGYLLLTGIGPQDDAAAVQRMTEKIVRLRLFPDSDGRFDRSLLDVGGGALVVSQFTLFGDTRKGRRPSFIDAAAPEHAQPLCDLFATSLRTQGVEMVETGRFGCAMQVTLVNDGPVTLWLDSQADAVPR